MAAKKLVMLVQRGPIARRYPFQPSYDGDVGFNLVAVATMTVPPGADLPPTDIPVDVRVKLPPGTWGKIQPRSGKYHKYPGLVLCSSPVDNGYTGPLDARVVNITRKPITVRAGVAIAQLVLYPIIVPEVREVDEMPKTARGGNRYGSTDAHPAKKRRTRKRSRT